MQARCTGLNGPLKRWNYCRVFQLVSVYGYGDFEIFVAELFSRVGSSCLMRLCTIDRGKARSRRRCRCVRRGVRILSPLHAFPGIHSFLIFTHLLMVSLLPQRSVFIAKLPPFFVYSSLYMFSRIVVCFQLRTHVLTKLFVRWPGSNRLWDSWGTPRVTIGFGLGVRNAYRSGLRWM